MEIFSSKIEKVVHNLKETSAMFCFLCLFLVKTLVSQDGDLIFGCLKNKMLCTVTLHIKHSGPESCVIDISLLFLFLLDPELYKLSSI